MNILITGGSRGIGAACVKTLTSEGHKVAFFYRQNQNAAEALAKEIAAAYNTTVAAAFFVDRPTQILTLSSGNPSDTKAEAEKHKNEWSLTFRLGEKGTDKPLYDAELQSRASVRVVPCELFDMTPVRVTSALPGEVTSLRATFTLADPNE